MYRFSPNGTTLADDAWKNMQWPTPDAVAMAEVSRNRAMTEQVYSAPHRMLSR